MAMTITERPTMTQRSPAAATPKPLLRGWLHLGMAPVILIAGLILTALAPTQDTRLASAAYTLSAVMLFGTSAAYHRGNWKPSTLAVFRRLDHSNIFIFIAGTYTPLSFALLEGTAKWTLVGLAWSVALLGVLFRLTWLSAPRWLYT
ncbi:MAG: hemolysin III family protein, partial [Propionibacterium sp.]|nr:hemolysin III family protein [Propionibacterium sp.]